MYLVFKVHFKILPTGNDGDQDQLVVNPNSPFANITVDFKTVGTNIKI